MSGKDSEGRDHVHEHLEELKSEAEPCFPPNAGNNFIRDFHRAHISITLSEAEDLSRWFHLLKLKEEN